MRERERRDTRKTNQISNIKFKTFMVQEYWRMFHNLQEQQWSLVSRQGKSAKDIITSYYSNNWQPILITFWPFMYHIHIFMPYKSNPINQKWKSRWRITTVIVYPVWFKQHHRENSWLMYWKSENRSHEENIGISPKLFQEVISCKSFKLKHQFYQHIGLLNKFMSLECFLYHHKFGNNNLKDKDSKRNY